ncbi:uncharacterized protein LOC114544315 isoform X2 [Dendronephthya gigantea]|uniref:uncharacterized protein LOC114544315 isoform X2 n=2 Tax=Dendronephthya gigantea TaxID=151771 RepID=UPI00106A1229|nr:uncharacterized protein LOC114544315 isoform X2 [Dendronephthya gigantea]
MWPDLQRLLQSNEGASRTERAQAVIDNPHLTDWFFMQRLQKFIKHWLEGVLDAEWFWYRFEYQARGSIHAHGCAKLKNDPDIRLLRKRACQAVLEKEKENEMSPDDFEFSCQEIVREGEDAERKLISYVDWLVTTVNDDLPDENWTLPDPHPSAVKATSVDNHDVDYHRLVNSVERHTRCSPAYCLKKKRVDLPAECRFGFPKPLQEETALIYEVRGKKNKSVHSELQTKRNDERLNSHNRVMLENWRANVDLQVIVDEKACARYMAKYAAKGEPRSKSASDILKLSVSSLQNDDQVSSAIKKAMIQVAGDRDMAAQETAHMLLSLPLVGCTYSFVTVSLENSRKVILDAENPQEEVLQNSVLQDYGERTKVESRYRGLSQLNLMQYASQFTRVRGELTKRVNPYIVRTFPKLTANPGSPTFGKYCKYQLIKFKPWEDKSSNAWDNMEETDDMFINTYASFLQTDFARDNVFGYSIETEMVHAAQTDETYGTDESSDESDDEQDQPNEEEQIEDWMLLCRLNQHYEDAGDQMANNEAVDWFEAARGVPGDLLRESAGWISKQRKDAEEQGMQYQTGDQQVVVDPGTLNDKQRLAFDIITASMANDECEPLHMIVSGTAGTAQLPIREYRELQGDSLQRLQLRLEGKRFLIIDEMSMIGHQMLSWLDNRLRAGTGKEDIPFGGMSIILMGDFGQLPPVGDKPMYIAGNGSVISDHGHSMYLTFDYVVILEQVMRQIGEDPEVVAFRALLMRMRDGQVTEMDWRLLIQHSRPNVSMDRFSDAIRLYFDKKSVAEYNYEKLLEIGQPLVKIQARHSGRGASAATSDEAGGLEAVLFLSTKAEVMLTCNLWAEVGLCNGSFGTVEQFWFAENMGPPNLPIAVLVHFPAYSGPAFLQECSKCIPVPPRLFEWMADGKYLSRQQLPLRLRYAMTIHKSQGQTLTKAVVDLGKGERVAGCTFVAASRVRSINDIVFEPMTFDRLKVIGRNKNLKKRQEAERRLRVLAEKTEQRHKH